VISERVAFGHQQQGIDLHQQVPQIVTLPQDSLQPALASLKLVVSLLASLLAALLRPLFLI
jgi:hypothetical protein